MSNQDRPTSSAGEHERAAQRLDAAKEEQSRVRGERDGAQGTAGDPHKEASLRVADNEVAARERWLKAVDDNDY